MYYDVLCNTSIHMLEYVWCFIYIYHHHVVPLARISLTLSRHFSLSFIASGLHPVSSHSCCVYVRAGRPAFAWPYVGVHRSTSLMSSSLLLQQCPACLVRLTYIVFMYTYIHTFIHMSMYTYIHTHISTYTYAFTNTHLCIYTTAQTHTHKENGSKTLEDTSHI